MEKKYYERYCAEIEKVENYEKALADNFKGWDCHHRLELIATGGICDVDKQDLIDWGIYYNRPADELIFLTKKEHTILHHRGMKRSEETRKKMSEVNKGKNNPMFGQRHSEETKQKMSESKKGERNPLYGKNRSEEVRKKIAEALKGKHWKLVDGKRVWY